MTAAVVDRGGRLARRSNGAWLVPTCTVVLYVVLIAGRKPFDLALPPGLEWVRRIAILALLAAGALVVRRTVQPLAPVRRTAVFVVLPLAYAVTTAWWGLGSTGVAKAATELLTMILLCVITIGLCRRDPTGVAVTMLWCLFASGLVFALAGLVTSDAGRMAAFGGGPNVFVRITGLGVLALVGLIVLKKAPPWTLFAVPTLLEATVASGSRGGMLALAVGALTLVPLVTSLTRFDRTTLATGLASLLLGAVVAHVFFGARASWGIQERIVKQTVDRMHTSGRGNLYADAVQLFTDHPVFGGGLRSFHAASSSLFYPHNVFLHFASEGGVVGVTLLSVALVIAALTYVRNLGDHVTVAIFACAALVFTAQNFSGDYYDNRFMFVFFLIGIHSATFVRLTATDHRQARLTRSKPRAS